jgi:hypothetical protein
MSKVVRVSDTDYKITVETGGTIVLDTGVNTPVAPAGWIGGVIITGDLRVLGNTTTVDTTNLAIEDNIILLNKGEAGNGITEGSAGIQIQRSENSANPSFPDVQILFDEAQDEIVLRYDGTGALIPLKINTIRTGSGNLNINTGLTGTGVISVSDVPDYELRATDPDDIPNIQWVYNYVLAFGGVALVDRFSAFDGTTPLDTGGRAYDTDAGDPTSKIEFTVDGINRIDLTTSGAVITGIVDIEQIRISGNRIDINTSNEDLVLGASGIGSVVVDENLRITVAGSDPAYNTDGTKIYVKDPAYGGSGLYFVDRDDYRDELVSRRKAIAYSMIF